MKILFVYPNVARARSPQLGLCMIAAVARNAGHDCDLFDFTSVPEGREPPEFEAALRKASPDLVAVSCRSNEWSVVDSLFRAVDTGRALKIFGGPHATVAPDEVLRRADVVVLGEGEETFANLLTRIEAGQSYADVAGCWVRDREGVHRNPMRDLIPDLNELPFPHWDLFGGIHFRNSDIAGSSPIFRVVGAFESSRGCPYSCTYCTNAYIRSLYTGKGRWRRRKSPERLVAEMERFRDRFGLDLAYLIDEVILTDRAWLEGYRDRVQKSGRVPFVFMERPENMKEDRVRLAREAGAYMVSIGIESGDECLREQVLNRKYSQESLVSAFRVARKQGLKTHAFTMVGFPGEDNKSAEDTYRILRRTRPHTVQTSIFYPLRGTELFDKVVTDGLFNPDEPMPTSYYGNTVLGFAEARKGEVRRSAFLLQRYHTVPGLRFFRLAQRNDPFFRFLFFYPHHAWRKYKEEGFSSLLRGLLRHAGKIARALCGSKAA